MLNSSTSKLVFDLRGRGSVYLRYWFEVILVNNAGLRAVTRWERRSRNSRKMCRSMKRRRRSRRMRRGATTVAANMNGMDPLLNSLICSGHRMALVLFLQNTKS